MAQTRRGRGDVAVEFRDVSRRFYLYHEQRISFQDWFIGLIRPRGRAEEFWALRDVSFSVSRGESLGILGRNGAGKSTLLKLVTRILEPTSGEVIINGNTHAMLELGAGFHPELSGRDNVYLNGSIYGHSRREMTRRFDQIVAFAELEQFIDTPVKHYSSGMFMRLGFAIAIHMDPEILVMDEILAVGDAAFQAKSYRALEQLKRQGTTILFVSHNAEQVKQFCDHAILLQAGQLIDTGPAADVVDHYQRLLHGTIDTVDILRVRVLNEFGEPMQQVQPGADLDIEILLRLPESDVIPDIRLALDLYDERETHLFGRSASLPADLPRQESESGPISVARGRVRALPLRHGTLTLVATASRGEHGEMLARRDHHIDITSPVLDTGRGMLHLEQEWQWQADNTVRSGRNAPGGGTASGR
jgi:ABC-type polysaccharide/polyol phosphate transport system ATPase subunit